MRPDQERALTALWWATLSIITVVCIIGLLACYPGEHVARFYPPANRVADPDRVRTAYADVTGTLRHVRRDRRYEGPCGILARVMGRCDDRRAYRATIVGDDDRKFDVLFFVAPSGVGMGDDTYARFVLHRDRVFRSDQCSRYGCNDEYWVVIESDADVLPP